MPQSSMCFSETILTSETTFSGYFLASMAAVLQLLPYHASNHLVISAKLAHLLAQEHVMLQTTFSEFLPTQFRQYTEQSSHKKFPFLFNPIKMNVYLSPHSFLFYSVLAPGSSREPNNRKSLLVCDTDFTMFVKIFITSYLK